MQTAPRVSVFIDPSVLFAAALSARGNARGLMILEAKENIELSWSSFVLAETRRNLEVKAPHALTDWQNFKWPAS